MNGCISDSSEHVIRLTKRICFIAVSFDRCMGGVGAGNQLVSKFRTMRRYQNVYEEKFLYCLDVSIFNNYVVSKAIYKDRAFHVFKQKLAEEMLEKNIRKIKRPQKKNVYNMFIITTKIYWSTLSNPSKELHRRKLANVV